MAITKVDISMLEDAGATGQVLTSDGTNWTSAAAGGGVDGITSSATETAINIDVNEIVTMPKQPGFDAYVNANQVDKTGDGTGFAITGAFWTELSDKNADFSNGTFTAPVSGLYSFTAMVSITGTTTSTTLFDFDLVLSNTSRRMFLSNNYGSVTGTNFIMTGALTAFMDAADTAYLLVTASGTGKLVDIGFGDDSRTTRFSGVLLL